jgi:hypothetical protein
MLDAIITGVISGITVFIGLYALLNSGFFEQRIQGILFNFIEACSQNEDLMKNLYQIGAIIGHGLTGGTGLQKRTGKFRWQDIIAQIAMQYFTKNLPASSENTFSKPLDEFK